MGTTPPINELDFFKIKENFKTFLKNQKQFKDFNFEGSNLNVLLDVLAYNTFLNNFYTNMAFSEMFLDSAVLRDSIISHTKALNYLPKSRKSSKAEIEIIFNATDGLNSIFIPKNTKFIARCGSRTFTFTNAESIVVNRNSDNNFIKKINIYEGIFKRELFVIDGENEQRFVINSSDVDIDSITVIVKETQDSSSNSIEFVRKNDLFGVNAEDNVFFIQPYSENRYEIVFGNNIFGNKPVAGNVVIVEYRITKGEESNGSKDFSLDEEISGTTSIINTISAASGGSERESEDSIKFFAPKALQIQERAITESDYEILLKQKFPEIENVSAIGGETLIPPQFGKVIVYVDTIDGEGLSQNNSNRYTKFLKSRSPLTVTPIIKPAEFLKIKLDIKSYFNPNLTDKSPNDLESIIRIKVNEFNDTYLNKFNSTFRRSQFTAVIDNSHSSITSTSITSFPFITIQPVFNSINNFQFSFKSEIKQSFSRIIKNKNRISTNPTVFSNNITFSGQPARLEDNGNGKMIIVSRINDEIIVHKVVGSVDYKSGSIILNDLSFDGVIGKNVEIFADLISDNISSPKERILLIDDSKTKISVEVMT